MRSARSEHPAGLPPLAAQATVNRPVSGPEYFHAASGTSAATLERAREAVLVVEGRFTEAVDEARWQQAIAAVAAANPALRMRWRGWLGWSRWTSDGPLPRLRVVHDCDWDLDSSAGDAFVRAMPLDLRRGPVVEFIIAHKRDGRSFVIFRTSHAVVDGMGGIQSLEELFRALRGEALVGSNATFSDSDLIRALAVPRAPSPYQPTCSLLPMQHALVGDDWWRVTLGAARGQVMAQVAAGLAAHAHQHSDLPALIAVPVDLRRHVPRLRTVTNFASMLLVRMDPGDGAEQFQARLLALIAERRDVAFGNLFDLLRWFPLRLIDRLLGRTRKNFARKPPVETVVLTNLGRIRLSRYAAPGFEPLDVNPLPQPGNAFVALMVIEDTLRLTINLPRTQSGGKPPEALFARLRDLLRAPD